MIRACPDSLPWSTATIFTPRAAAVSARAFGQAGGGAVEQRWLCDRREQRGEGVRDQDGLTPFTCGSGSSRRGACRSSARTTPSTGTFRARDGVLSEFTRTWRCTRSTRRSWGSRGSAILRATDDGFGRRSHARRGYPSASGSRRRDVGQGGQPDREEGSGAGGVCLLDTEEAQTDALSKLALDDIWGIGGRLAPKLMALGDHDAARTAGGRPGDDPPAVQRCRPAGRCWSYGGFPASIWSGTARRRRRSARLAASAGGGGFDELAEALSTYVSRSPRSCGGRGWRPRRRSRCWCRQTGTSRRSRSTTPPGMSG